MHSDLPNLDKTHSNHSQSLRIRLHAGVRFFTTVKHARYVYLGTVQRGLQIGALARTPEGDYVQVNGAIVQPLNPSHVLSALRRAQATEVAGRASQPASPTVTVRRRRLMSTPA